MRKELNCEMIPVVVEEVSWTAVTQQTGFVLEVGPMTLPRSLSSAVKGEVWNQKPRSFSTQIPFTPPVSVFCVSKRF